MKILYKILLLTIICFNTAKANTELNSKYLNLFTEFHTNQNQMTYHREDLKNTVPPVKLDIKKIRRIFTLFYNNKDLFSE